MGFLADLGRSNVGQTSRLLFNDVMKYGEATRRDDLSELQMAHTAQQMQLQQAHEARLIKAQAEKDAANNRIVDMTIHPAFLSLPDEQKKAALKYFSDSGFTDKSGKGRAIDVQAGVASIENDKKLFYTFMEPVVQAKKQAAIDAWGDVQAAQATGDKAKIDKAMATFNTAKMAYMASDEKFSGHLMKLDENEAKKKEVTPEFGTVATGEGVFTYEKHTGKKGQRLGSLTPRATGSVGGAKKTALILNTEFLTSLGFDKKEAANMLASSKPMSRESFIGQATLKVINNEMIPEDEKAGRIQEAIRIFDSSTKKAGATPTAAKVLTEGVSYLKAAKNREDAKARIRVMAEKGWSREDIAAAAKEANWE